MTADDSPITRTTSRFGLLYSIANMAASNQTPILTFSISLTIYLIVMPGDISWSYFGGDGGELITASVTLGVPHPPGYPLYILFGKLISLLPVGTLAFRFHLLSAIGAATAAAFVSSASEYLALARIGMPKHSKVRVFVPSLLLGLLFAFFPLVWSQAIIAEVYTVNLAIIGALILVLITKRSSFLAGILLGLGLLSHQTSLLMLPLSLYLIPQKRWYLFAGGIIIGFTPVASLLFLARSGSPLIWAYPISFSEFFWLISGKLYSSNLLTFPVSNYGNRATIWFSSIFFPLGILLVFAMSSKSYRSWRMNSRFISAGFGTAISYTVIAFTYRTDDAIILLLPAILISCVIIAPGIKISNRSALLLAIAMTVIGAFYITTNRLPSIRPRFEQALTTIPPGAIAVTPGDPTVAATWYFAYAELMRPDIIIVDENMFQFNWYRQHLEQQHSDLKGLAEDNLDGFIQTNATRFPLCHLSLYLENTVTCINS